MTANTNPFLEDLRRVVADQFDTAEIDQDGDLMLIRDGASCALWITPEETGPATRILRLVSPVVMDIELDDIKMAFKALFEVNRLNNLSSMGRWRLDFGSDDESDSAGGTILFSDEIFLYGDQGLDSDAFKELASGAYRMIDHLDDQIIMAIGSGRLTVREEAKSAVDATFIWTPE